jgi:alkylation response protein AidB-like acyl-CoA dehydrogenase
MFLQADLGMEIHVISSAGKPIAGWIARDAIQDCREACGGHGYLRGSVQCIFASIRTISVPT